VRIDVAGWTAELRGDELADISYQGTRLLRAIRVVVRDHDWRTAPPVRRRLVISGPQDGSRALRLDIDVVHRDGAVEFQWIGEITFRPGGLGFALRGAALRTFRRNRIGIVVLHPIEDAGRAVEVTEPDGATRPGRLPVAISPHQPLRNIRALRWSTGDVGAHLQLTGEVFETEDQRNWTDASFKTYCTPLAEPFPVTVTAGQRVEQSAILSVTASPVPVRAIRRTTTSDIPIALSRSAGPLPAFGLGCSTVDLGLPEPERTPHPTAAALLVELDLRQTGRWARLASALAEARAWRAELDVRLITDDPGHIAEAVDRLVGHPLCRIGVFHPASHVTEGELWTALTDQLARLPRVSPVGGTRAHFTELNRTLDRLPADIPELTFGITPQMHAVEREHVVDSIAGQRQVAENAVRLAGGRPLHVGPITLKPRFNAVATTSGLPVVPIGDQLLAERTDQRQSTAFAAAWMLASAQALAIDGVTSLTYFETVGPRGLRPTGDRPVYPTFPLTESLMALTGPRVEVESDLPEGLALLAASTRQGTVAIASNISRTTRRLRFVRPAAVTGVTRIGAADPARPAPVITYDGRYPCLDLAPDDVVQVSFDPRRAH
jgi:hypothetical protein